MTSVPLRQVWKTLDLGQVAQIKELAEQNVFFVENFDPLGIRNQDTYESKFLGCLISQIPAGSVFDDSQKNWITTGSDAILLQYLRAESRPRSTEPPLNSDAFLVGGGSGASVILHGQHHPQMFWSGGSVPIAGIPYPTMIQEMRETGKLPEFKFSTPVPCYLSLEICNGHNPAHDLRIQQTGKCLECQKPAINVSFI